MIAHILIRLMADGALIPVVVIGLVTLIIKVPTGHRFAAYARILMAGLTSYYIATLVGSMYQPASERPFELLGASAGALFLNNPGFPSDHTLFATAITCAVWFETRQKLVTIILAGLTIIICIGRVLALVHTPLDVTGGVVIGMIGAVWYVNTYQQKVVLRAKK